MADLAGKTCVPCRGVVSPLKGKELQDLAKQVSGWKVVNEHHITKSFTFPDFKAALAFVNKVGDVAESQGHHPDILLARRRSPPGRTRSTASLKAISSSQRSSTSSSPATAAPCRRQRDPFPSARHQVESLAPTHRAIQKGRTTAADRAIRVSGRISACRLTAPACSEASSRFTI